MWSEQGYGVSPVFIVTSRNSLWSLGLKLGKINEWGCLISKMDIVGLGETHSNVVKFMRDNGITVPTSIEDLY